MDQIEQQAAMIVALQAQLQAKDALIVQQTQTINEFKVQADRYVELENRCADQSIEIDRLSRLAASLTQSANRDAFAALAKGWMNSAIGIRVNAIPEIDQSNLLVGIVFGDFEIIRTAYSHILKRLKELKQPATEDEQIEIRQLMDQAGFA